jgi:hypothetical protein
VQKAGLAMRDDFRQAADARGDDGRAAGHRFRRGKSEALLRRRQQKHIGDRQQLADVVLLAEDFDVFREIRFRCLLREARALGTIAGEHELRAIASTHAAEHVEHRVEAFHRTEV